MPTLLQTIARLRRRQAHAAPPPRPADAARQIIIPVAGITREERDRRVHHDRGTFLVRQDMWAELAQDIADADAARRHTGAGLPVADILAYGARADATLPLGRGDMPDTSGIDALEAVLAEMPDSYPVGLVVALAHIDAGWAWRGTDWTHEVPFERLEEFHRHFHRAAEILDRFDPFALGAPSLAAAQCALLPGTMRPAARVADDYEDLIDLDPMTPRHMRALGNHMLPRWFGSFDALERVARATAARTADIWGVGAYTWVYFDALAVDSRALVRLDSGLFLEGMADILHRCPDQHNANLMTAFCGLVMAPRPGPHGAIPEQAAPRAALHSAFDSLLHHHLREIHPMVWADARARFCADDPLPDPQNAGEAGYAAAIRAISGRFGPEMSRGTRVLFSDAGIRLDPLAH